MAFVPDVADSIIVKKEPDVFETEDILEEPAKENIDFIMEAPNENIDKTKLSRAEIYPKFSDKIMDTSKQDYSDSLQKKRLKRGGFLAGQIDFEMEPIPTKNESPAQRFHRLQYEVKSFPRRFGTKEGGKEGRSCKTNRS